MPTSKVRSGYALAKRSSPVPDGHRRGDRDDRRVGLGLLDQLLGEHVLIRRRPRRRLGLRAGDDVELLDAVIFVRRRLGRAIALALLGHDMDQDRALLAVADILEHRDQMVEIMAVDRADIIEAEFLEQRAAGDHAAREFLGLFARRCGRGARACAVIFLARLRKPEIFGRRRPSARDRPTARRPAARSTCRCR